MKPNLRILGPEWKRKRAIVSLGAALFSCAPVFACTLSVSASLPNAFLGQPYSGSVSASADCPGTITFGLGGLPGVSVDPVTGVVSGTPSAALGTPFTVTASATEVTTNQQELTASMTYSVLIAPSTTGGGGGGGGGGFSCSIQISSPTILPSAVAGQFYFDKLMLTQTQCANPFTWTATTALPAGLSLSTVGELTGSPTAPGAFSFTVMVTTGNGTTATQQFSISISPANSGGGSACMLTILTASPLPNAVDNIYYSQGLNYKQSGCVLPIAWNPVPITPGPGLTLSSGGLISGTANVDGSYMFTAVVHDASGHQVSQSFSVTVYPPIPLPSTIQNGASLKSGPVAPGEIITILGTNLGPSMPASFTVNSQGSIDPTLAGVQVMFDSFPGTPTYVSATQVNVVVPYEIAGRSSTNLSVVHDSQPSVVFSQAVSAAAPAIFTFNATGQGQAIAENVTGPTGGTYNGPSSGVVTPGATIGSSPATQGSFIAVYATGCGLTSPPATTGSVDSATLLMPLANWTPTSGTVTATIGGVSANITFAGAAPGLISGVYQFDIQVPDGVSGDTLPLAITVDGISTAAGPTIAVQ